MIVEDPTANLPDHSDICIVGAGPVGLALACKLAAEGRRVLVLEAGGAFDDLTITEPADIEIAAGGHHAPIRLAVRPGLGGTSRLWGGRCVAFDDIDFAPRSFVDFSGWPIRPADLRQHYEEAFAFLGCGTARTVEPKEPGDPDQEVWIESLEQWSAEPDIGRLHGARLRASERIQVHTGCTVDRIRLSADGERVAGLRVRRADRHLQVTAKTYVLAAGGLENARLLLAVQRDQPRKFGGAEGALGRFYAGHLTGYLAAIEFSGAEIAQELWFRSCGDGSHLRRRLAITPSAQLQEEVLNTAFWLDSFSVSDPGHGSGVLSLLYLITTFFGLYRRFGRGLAPSPTALVDRGYRQHLRNLLLDPWVIGGSWRLMKQIAERRIQSSCFALRNPRRRYLLRYHAEQIPNPESRVRLRQTGEEGNAGSLMVDFRYHSQDVESVLRSHDILDRWLQRRAFGRLDYLQDDAEARRGSVLNQALDGYHQIGTTRMSDAPSQGVVDPQCRVHDLANCYVAGSSVFPTSGQANPTLPAVALALRLATHLSAQARVDASRSGAATLRSPAAERF
ncbi:GMC family oxidoreductase [Consotaella aegiceratis]|uniref:GMC family oxidoreductase n=1 Tax=Consotaella aegiceratis TaxID=3097961 RepID=UPI002F400DBC